MFLPLTLASETQHRFKVYVRVDRDDRQAVNTIESHLKGELRLLRDVDIVGERDNWEYIIENFVLTLEFEDGRKTGYFAIATHYAIRLVERIKADQGLFQEIIPRTDIPKRTDLGDIPRYDAPENKIQFYGEQAGYCNGGGTHF